MQVFLGRPDLTDYRAVEVIPDDRASGDGLEQSERLDPEVLQDLVDSDFQERQVPLVLLDFLAVLVHQAHRDFRDHLAGLGLRASQVGVYNNP